MPIRRKNPSTSRPVWERRVACRTSPEPKFSAAHRSKVPFAVSSMLLWSVRRPPRHHRQGRLGAVQSLDLGVLIDAEPRCGSRRAHVRADHVTQRRLDLGSEDSVTGSTVPGRIGRACDIRPPCPCRSRTGPPSTFSARTQCRPRAACATCPARSLPQPRRRAQPGGRAPPGCAPPQRLPQRRSGYAQDGPTSARTRTAERSRRSKHSGWPTPAPWPGAPVEPARCANEPAAPAWPAVPPSSPKPKPRHHPSYTTPDHSVSDPPPGAPSGVLLRNATPSVFHQRHLGRVLRSSRNPRGRRLASSRGREPQPGRCPSLWPGDVRNDGISVATAGADGSET